MNANFPGLVERLGKRVGFRERCLRFAAILGAWENALCVCVYTVDVILIYSPDYRGSRETRLVTAGGGGKMRRTAIILLARSAGVDRRNQAYASSLF